MLLHEISVAQQQSQQESFGITRHYLAAFNALNYVVFLNVDVTHGSHVEASSKKQYSCHCCHNLSAKDTDQSFGHPKTGLF